MKSIEISGTYYPVRPNHRVLSWAGNKMGMNQVINIQAVMQGITNDMLAEFIHRCLKEGCKKIDQPFPLSVADIDDWINDGEGVENIESFYAAMFPAKKEEEAEVEKKVEEKNLIGTD